MYWHWQNLNDRKGRTGSGWRHGRAWWQFARRTLRVEWSHFRHPRLAVELSEAGGDGDELGLHVALLFGAWWVSISHCRTHDADTAFGVRTGFTLWGDWLRFFWRHNSDTGEKIGREWGVHLLDVLLGQHVYREGAAYVHRITVQMPEGSYTGTCTLRPDSWKRARWFRKTIWRAHVEMDEGQQIPVPGKGENAWDCDEDAIFGSTFPCRTADHAAERMRASALETRTRHGGGLAWRPAASRG